MRTVTRTFASVALLAFATALHAGDPPPGTIVPYVSSLTEDAIIKLVDLNGDGTFNGAGETIMFFGPGNDTGFPGVGSAQTILVLGYDHILAGDGESNGPFEKRVYRLRDLTGDGTAMNAGEASVFWDGWLPGYNTLFDRPKDMAIGPDGAIYLADNNTIDFSGETPEAIWRLEDLTGDGIVDSSVPGEVTLHKELCPPGNAFCFIIEDIKWHSDGRLYFSNQNSSQNTEHVWILLPDGALTPYASEDNLFGIGLTKVGMTLHPETENVVMAAYDVAGNRRIIEMADLNGNGYIDDNSELKLLYRSDTAADFVTWGIPNSAMDIEFAPDGSLWLLDNNAKRIIRFEDLDGDGTFQGPGEARYVYDASVAQAKGGIVMDFPRTIGFATVPCATGDLNCDGVVDGADLLILLSAWSHCDDPNNCAADLNEDGIVDGADLLILLSNWG
jgi:hypothetical protein